MIITKTVSIKWSRRIKKWYEEKGYIFTKMGDEFEIKVEDLTSGSHVAVGVKCDSIDCKNPIVKFMSWQKYNDSIGRNGEYRCKKCAVKERIENTRLTKLKNGTSFEQWCLDNSWEDVLFRWDDELNDCSPSEINLVLRKNIISDVH